MGEVQWTGKDSYDSAISPLKTLSIGYMQSIGLFA